MIDIKEVKEDIKQAEQKISKILLELGEKHKEDFYFNAEIENNHVSLIAGGQMVAYEISIKPCIQGF